MTRRRTFSIAVGVLILLAGAIALYARHGMKVRVHNAGSETLRSVVVHVTGNSYPLGELAPDARRSVRVTPKGESNVEISFQDAKGDPKWLDAGGYVEPGYRGTISIDLDSGRILKVESNGTMDP